jgi:hypothetical protein
MSNSRSRLKSWAVGRQRFAPSQRRAANPLQHAASSCVGSCRQQSSAPACCLARASLWPPRRITRQSLSYHTAITPEGRAPAADACFVRSCHHFRSPWRPCWPRLQGRVVEHKVQSPLTPELIRLRPLPVPARWPARHNSWPLARPPAGTNTSTHPCVHAGMRRPRPGQACAVGPEAVRSTQRQRGRGRQHPEAGRPRLPKNCIVALRVWLMQRRACQTPQPQPLCG